MGKMLTDTADPAQSRPRSIKIFGWLNVILGSAGLLTFVVVLAETGWRGIRFRLESPYLWLPYLVALG